MKELCVLFLHHADDELTRHHASLVQRYNPSAAFVPLTFNNGLRNAILPSIHASHGLNEWRNTDRLVYTWFHSTQRVLAERYLIIEFDTFCSMPFENFYAQAWDMPASCARVITQENDPGWQWFAEIPDHHIYRGNLTGMSPLCAVMLVFSALAAMTKLVRDPIYDPLFCECRIGTLANAAGYRPVMIRPDIDRYISWQSRSPRGPGVWHSVKSKTLDNAATQALVLPPELIP
jgi:hypothetical protein